MGYGDEILAAGQAQRWFEAHQEPSVIVDTHQRPRWHPIWAGNPAIVPPAAARLGMHTITNAPHARPYIVYPFTEDTGWTFNQTFRARDHIARIYLTEAEQAPARALQQRLGPYFLIEPFTKHPNLRWPLDRWQLLVCEFPDVPFVQHVHKDSPLLDDVEHVPATFRQACAYVRYAAAYLRSESGLCHAAAAFGTPNLVVWGACMDWDVLGGYPKQVGLVRYDDGYPCGRWRPCAHCQQALVLITVEMAVVALRGLIDCLIQDVH